MSPKRHPFKNFEIESKRVRVDKGKLRLDIEKETERFLSEGGCIRKLNAAPSPKIPTVGMKGSAWEDSAGAGSLFDNRDALTEQIDEMDLMLGPL